MVGPGGALPGPGGPGSTALTQADMFASDLALVRVYDPTVKPGEVYQYRIRVAMLNPNFGRQDVASTGFSKEKEIVADEWYEIPGAYATPSDLNCYVTESKVSSDLNRVNLEVYKWATAVKRPTATVPLGDWVKAILSVGRCEFVGRTSRIELVPYWRSDVDGYSFVPIDIPRQANAKKGLDVDFKPDLGEKGDFFVVDFEGPNYRYEKLIQKDGDVSGRSVILDSERSVEIFLMGSNGRLIVRSSVNDEGDPDRKRVEALVERHRSAARAAIQAAKSGGGGQPGGAPGAGGGSPGNGSN